MKLATLILPPVNNVGIDQTDTHAALQLVLIDTFGGFTVITGNGGWKDDNTGRVFVEAVAVYSIAMDDTAENARKLESIARFYGHVAGQICVMVTHASGVVAFVDSVATVQEFA